MERHWRLQAVVYGRDLHFAAGVQHQQGGRTGTYKYRTLFEQSDRLVKISAAVFDKDGNALKETGLVIKPEGSGLYAQDNTGKIALIGVSVEEEDEYGNTVSKIKLTADHIQLEGLVTTNGNFKILEDGSIETTNGKFTGEIDSSKGKIGGFEIGNYRIGSVVRLSRERWRSCHL
ncbi:hypothetical protein NXW38_25610 [Bacteroides ovatus]|nr:hypothetical protein [Bacteroides ovatus]